MNAFRHSEGGPRLRPRHPVVCTIDVIGFVAAVGLVVVFRPSFVTAILPLAIALQYVVSFIHHWFSYSEWRSKIDRSIIFLVIAATYVPYWGGLLPAQEAWLRLPWVAVAAIVGLRLLYSGISERLVGLYWAAFASAGLIISFYELQQWLPPAGLAAFWIATSFYGASQLVFALKYPNPFPNLFGYREVQHLFLLAATTIGSIVALLYT